MIVSNENSIVFILIFIFVCHFKCQNLIERLLHFVLSARILGQVRRPLLCVCAVLDSHLLRCRDILNSGDDSERAIANDAQPMHENAEEYLAGLSRPTYYRLRHHIANLKYNLAILLCLLHLAHVNGISQQEERVKLCLLGVARIFEQSQGIGEKV